MKSRLLTVSLILLIAAASHWRRPCREWLLGPEPAISVTAIQEEASRLSFRQSSLTDAVTAASQKLIQQLNLRQRRLTDTMFHADVTEAVSNEMLSWQRQWEKEEDRQQRLGWQRMGEAEMERTICEALLDQAWIEKQIAPEIQVTDAELEAGWLRQQKHLEIPAARHVAHLFLSRHGPNQKDRTSEIISIHQRLSEGEKWPVLVQKHSEDPRTKNQGGDLGWLAGGRVPQEITTAIRQMNAGDTSPPLRTDLGWHIVRVLEKHPVRAPQFEDVRTELEASMTDQKRAQAIDRLIQRLLHSHPGTTL